MSWNMLAYGLILLSLPGTLELGLLTFGAWLPLPRPRNATRTSGVSRLAVVIPAHDEEQTIGACIESLRGCERPSCESHIVVVADNCSDGTANAAERHDATVLVRTDPLSRGKGHALNYAFRLLLDEGFDAFIVIDADSWVDRNLLTAFEAGYAGGADALQCVYRAPDRPASTRARLAAIIWFAFNVVRLRARHAFGLTVGILGNGFGLTRKALEIVPYDVGSITEDLEYFLRLTLAGVRVEFLPDTTVWSELPESSRGAEAQRARWEGGRFRAIREWTPMLLGRVLRGEARALEPLLELSLLPLSYHAMLLLPLLVIPSDVGRLYGVAALCVLALHAVTAVRLGWHWRDLLLFARIPLYLLWKIAMLPRVLASAGRSAHWVRTERKGS